MRHLLTVLALGIALGAAGAPPAAASLGDPDRESSQRRHWSEGRYIAPEEPGRGQPRRRLARAFVSDADYGVTVVRPRRWTYDRETRVYRPRYTQRRHLHGRRHAKSRRHLHRHHREARRPGVRRRATAQRRHRPAHRRAAAPARVKPGAVSGQLGVASFYWKPQRVASGGMFNPNAMTAAHKTLPFGTGVRVTHLGNGRSVEVRINDRGPYVAGRIIDLSRAAAGVLGMTRMGIARVRVEVLPRRPKG
jgi:rare lipoprotein A